MALAPWTAGLLLLVAAWVITALIMETGARIAHRLAHLRAPDCFRAPPHPVAEGERTSLAFLGDVQRGVSDVTRPLVDALAERPADLLVSTGDLASHGEAPYYGIVLDALEAAGLDTPARVVPGNHDLHPRRVRDPAAGRALFRERFGACWWSERVGPLLVVGLDDAVAPVEGEQRDWLRRTLEENGSRPWIAVCHRPPRFLDRPDSPCQSDLADLVAVFDAHPPLIVVSGHGHQRLERRVDGVLYVVNAHGGDVHGLALRRGPFDLLRVDVEADGTATHTLTHHGRKPWLRVYLHQLAVRGWSSRRRLGGALLAAPATAVFALLGIRAPRDPGPLDPA